MGRVLWLRPIRLTMQLSWQSTGAAKHVAVRHVCYSRICSESRRTATCCCCCCMCWLCLCREHASSKELTAALFYNLALATALKKIARSVSEGSGPVACCPVPHRPRRHSLCAAARTKPAMAIINSSIDCILHHPAEASTAG
jgi:hypothetical protein